MKTYRILSLVIIVCVLAILVSSTSLSFEENYNIPSWVKNNAKWWSQGQVGDSDFEKGIEYLIDQKIINIPPQNQTASGATTIPVWIKNIAGMWTSGKVSDNEFYTAIEYLVRIGVIHVQISTKTPPTVSNLPTPSTSQSNENMLTPQLNGTNPVTNPVPPVSNQPIVVPPVTSQAPSLVANVQSTNSTKSNQTVSSTTGATVQNTNTQTNKANANSLIGTGVNLKINGNVVSGILTFSGIQYTAPSLIMTKQGSQIQLQGNVQTTTTSLLEVVGVTQNGSQYNFYGTISNNGQSLPIQFTATLGQGNSQVTVQVNQTINSSSLPTNSPPQPVTKPQVPTLPMLMLYAQSDHVYMGYPYNLAVKIFDPKTNPDKTFDQFNGGIAGVNINGTILGQNNQTLSSFSGITDGKGLYQYSILAPYYQGWTQTFKVIVNAIKNGYAPQSATMSFVTLYPAQGGTQCSSTAPSTPTNFAGNLNPTPPPTEINLSWTASSGASSYTIFRGQITHDYNVTLGPTSQTTFSDTSVVSGKTYFYVIEASNCGGKSLNSTEISKAVP